MAVTVVVTEGFVVRLLQTSEHSSLTAIAKEHSIPYQTLMALQRNNKAIRHTVILERYCSTTQNSRPPSWAEEPDRQQVVTTSKLAEVQCPSILCYGPPCARPWQAQRCSARATRATGSAEMLLSARTTADQAIGSPDDDLALKLHWGRQRGLAVIFGTDAIECARRESGRHFLGESVHERSAVGITSEQYILGDLACTISTTPLPKALGGSKSPQAQLEANGKLRSGLVCTKLAIPEDACSVDGPPTPDNEEADRVCMPAAKRQRLDACSPPAAAVAVARILHHL